MSSPLSTEPVGVATSEKIRVIGLLLTLAVVFHHGFNEQFASGPVAEPLRWAEDLVHFGLRGLAVPFFFACSAYFLCARPEFARAWPGEVRKRVRSLLVPFLLWSAAWLLVMRGLEAVPRLAPSFGREMIHLSDWRQTLRLLVIDIIPHPLWYLRDLFLLTLVSPVVRWCMRSQIAATLYFAVALILWSAVPSLALRESQDLFWFGIGALLAVRGPIIWRPSRAQLGLGASAAVALTIINILYVRRYAVEQPLVFNLSILIGLPALWYATDALRGTAVWPRLLASSRWALFIYLGHEPLQSLVRKPLLLALGGSTAALATVWIGVGAAVIVGLALAGEALSRVAPRCYGLLTGGRALTRQRGMSSPVAAPGIAVATAT